MAKTEERREKAQEYFQVLEELTGNLIELMRDTTERLDRLEQRMAELESRYEQIPWAVKPPVGVYETGLNECRDKS